MRGRLLLMVLLAGCGGPFVRFRVTPDQVTRVRFLTRSRVLVSAESKPGQWDLGPTSVWDVDSGRRVAELEVPDDWSDVAVSPDDAYLALGRGVAFVDDDHLAGREPVRVWRLPDCEPVATWPSADGDRWPIRTVDAWIWRVASGERQRLPLDIDVRTMCLSPDHGRLAAYGVAGVIQLVDLEATRTSWLSARREAWVAPRRGEALRLEREAEAAWTALHGLRASAPGSGGPISRSLRVAQRRHGEAQSRVHAFRHELTPRAGSGARRSMLWHPRHQQTIYSWGPHHAAVEVWGVGTGETVGAIGGHRFYGIKAAAITPDGEFFVTVGVPFAIIRRTTSADGRQWKVVRRLQRTSGARTAAVSGDGRWLAIGGGSGLVLLRRAPSDLQPWQVVLDSDRMGAIDEVAFDPGSRRLAAAGGGEVAVWELADIR